MKIALILLAFVVCQWSLGLNQVNAYYPGHPEVQAMVSKGVSYLENLSNKDIESGRFAGREYHIIVVAYAHLKANHDPNAAIVKKGIQSAKRVAKDIRAKARNRDQSSGNGSGSDHADKSNYALSIAIILLCEADSTKHKSDIEELRNLLLSKQQPGGGFGYPHDDQGDVSQTQYVVLAMWAMQQNGIPVKPEPVNRVHQWLIRVQDVDGAWPYRAKDPGPGKGRIVQTKGNMSHSTALAGASSILIAGDYFGIWRGGDGDQDGGVLPGMPLAVKLPNAKVSANVDSSKSVVPRNQIIESVERMNAYRRAVPYEKSGSAWHYYAMYSLERFESFYEFATGQEGFEAQWYDSGVEKLKRNQSQSGGWGGVSDRTNSSPPVATAFAILFLVRSTQQSIAASSGTLGGGQGLPKDTTDIKVSGTKIKGRPVAAAVDQMLDLLEDDSGDLEGKSIPEDMKLAKDPKERRAQLDRLERLVRGSRSWQARRVAARLLGKSEQMRVVPTLIFALSDPDTSVRRYARDGLRFISRKFDGFGLPNKPTNAEVEAAQKQWRRWYLRVNPKYVFLEE